MKKALFLAAALLLLTACHNNKQQSTETNDNSISEEMKQANMQEVQAYLKDCGTFFIATADGDQPRVRPSAFPKSSTDTSTS